MKGRVQKSEATDIKSDSETITLAESDPSPLSEDDELLELFRSMAKDLHYIRTVLETVRIPNMFRAARNTTRNLSPDEREAI